MSDFATGPEPPPKPSDARRSVEPVIENRSSVRLSVNAKGRRQWEVKAVALDDTAEALRAAAQLAAEIDRGFEATYGAPS